MTEWRHEFDNYMNLCLLVFQAHRQINPPGILLWEEFSHSTGVNNLRTEIRQASSLLFLAVLKHLWVLTSWNVLFLVVDHFLSVGSGAVIKSENFWKIQLLAKYNIDVVRDSSISRDFLVPDLIIHQYINRKLFISYIQWFYLDVKTPCVERRRWRTKRKKKTFLPFKSKVKWYLV